jgi:hypothetical protein
MTQQLLDPIPIWALFLVFAAITLLCYEVGYRVGVWWQDRMPGEQEGPNDVLVGALLALLAFLLAVTMGMAADRFDTRRGIVLSEANAIETTFLRADYLPAPAAAEMKGLLRQYAPLRVATNDPARIQANLQRSEELLREMWAIQAGVTAAGHDSDLIASFGESLNELNELAKARVIAALYARVPDTVVVLLLVGSALALAMLGYSAGLRKRRSVLSALVLVVASGIVLMLVIDLDRPQDGFVTVSQRPLLDVQARIGPPASPAP